MKKSASVIVGIWLLSISSLKSQCALIPIDLPTRFQNSELVVEASIVKCQPFRSSEDGHIYTANYLELHKSFKGLVPQSEIVLISPGGYLDGESEEVIPSINVTEGVTGTFFLYPSNISADNSLSVYKAYSGPQGCIYYDLVTGQANDVFNKYASIEEELYPQLLSLASGNITQFGKLDLKKVMNSKAATVIDSVSPDTSAAGVKAEIRIWGSGFDSTQGTSTLSFSNASTGGQWIEPVGSQFLFWSDTLIIVQVPSRAGTGFIRISTGSGNAVIGGPKILYSHLNYLIVNKTYYPFHKDNDGQGGFEWKMSTEFDANSGAKDAFLRAINTWKDNTCINWYNGPATAIDKDQADGVNNVRFAEVSELEAGVLAITRNYWKECKGNVSYPDEIDLSYDPSTNWHTGTSSPPINAMDMESVIVHELGHAHELGHVIDNGDFMHATIGNGQFKRTLTDNNIDGGLYVMKNSVVEWACGPEKMTASGPCIIPVVVGEFESGALFNLYPNPFSSLLVIRHDGGIERKISVRNTFGQEVGNIILQKDSTIQEWNVPASLREGLYFFLDNSSGLCVGKAFLRK